MPVRKVIKNGQTVGYQYGNQKIFPTKAQANAQAAAIHIARKKKK